MFKFLVQKVSNLYTLLYIYLYLLNYFPAEMETCNSVKVIKREKKGEKDAESERSIDINYPPKYKKDKMFCCRSSLR